MNDQNSELVSLTV